MLNSVSTHITNATKIYKYRNIYKRLSQKYYGLFSIAYEDDVEAERSKFDQMLFFVFIKVNFNKIVEFVDFQKNKLIN